eukprot:3821714-Prymnesium_polylepis.1
MAVRDFAEARRLAFDDHASKIEQKLHVAAIDCAEKKRRHDRVAAQLGGAEGILQGVAARVQHRMLVDKLGGAMRAAAAKH